MVSMSPGTVADLIAKMATPEAREKATLLMPDRLLRAELPALGAGPADLAKIKQEVAADLAAFEAMHVLACIVVLGMFSHPEIYSELDDDSGAVVEWVASILLERSSPEPTAEDATEHGMSAAIQRTLDRTRGITMQTMMDAKRREDSAETPMEAIAACVEMHDTTSRWPGFSDQAGALITALAADEEIGAYLRAELGFDLEQALALEVAAGRLLTDRMNDHRENVAEFAHKAAEAIDAEPEEFPEMLRAASDAHRHQRAMFLLSKAHFSEQLRESLMIGAEDLAAEADVDIVVADAFLRAFSIEFGEVKGTSFMTGRNAVRARPFVSDGNGGYLLTLAGNLRWGIRPLVEATLKADQEMFTKYSAVRSAYVEQETAASFRKAFKVDRVWTNVSYRLDGKTYEADVIAIVDDVCIVVEVKSGELSAKAWRGRKTELRRDLEALLGKGSEQCSRLAAEIQTGQPPEFFDRASKESVAIPLASVARVEAVVVTLEGLGFTGLLFPKLREAGFFGEDEPPWIVSLYDLGAIADCTAYTPQFTGYIRRRRELDSRVTFLDECDLWMLHLRETLDFSLVKGDVIFVDGRSDDLNKAWMFGGRLPTMNLDKRSKRRLKELDRKRPVGFAATGEEVIATVQQGKRPKVHAYVSGLGIRTLLDDR